MAKLRVEKRLITLPPGSTIGPPICFDDPSGCCGGQSPPASGSGSGPGGGGDTHPVICTCTKCKAGAPQQWTVDVAGFGDLAGGCTCSLLNLTGIVLNYDTINVNSSPCQWSYGSGGTLWVLFYSVPNDLWILELVPNGCANPIAYALSGAQFNCRGTNVLSLVTDPSGLCAAWPSTLTIVPGQMTGTCGGTVSIPGCCNSVPIKSTLYATIADTSNIGALPKVCTAADGLVVTLSYAGLLVPPSPNIPPPPALPTWIGKTSLPACTCTVEVWVTTCWDVWVVCYDNNNPANVRCMYGHTALNLVTCTPFLSLQAQMDIKGPLWPGICVNRCCTRQSQSGSNENTYGAFGVTVTE